MPVSLIQSVLGLSFVLIWVFIGTMILRDRLHAIRGEQTSKDERTPAPRRARAPRNLREKVVQPGNSSRRRRDATAA